MEAPGGECDDTDEDDLAEATGGDGSNAGAREESGRGKA